MILLTYMYVLPKGLSSRMAFCNSGCSYSEIILAKFCVTFKLLYQQSYSDIGGPLLRPCAVTWAKCVGTYSMVGA